MRPDITKVVEEMSFITRFFPDTSDDPLQFLDGELTDFKGPHLAKNPMCFLPYSFDFKQDLSIAKAIDPEVRQDFCY